MRRIKEPTHRQQETLSYKRRNRRHTGMLHWKEYKISLKKQQRMTMAEIKELVVGIVTENGDEEEPIVIHTPGVTFPEDEHFGGKNVFDHFEDAKE